MACYKELDAQPAVLMRPPAPKNGRRGFGRTFFFAVCQSDVLHISLHILRDLLLIVQSFRQFFLLLLIYIILQGRRSYRQREDGGIRFRIVDFQVKFRCLQMIPILSRNTLRPFFGAGGREEALSGS